MYLQIGDFFVVEIPEKLTDVGVWDLSLRLRTR